MANRCNVTIGAQCSLSSDPICMKQHLLALNCKLITIQSACTQKEVLSMPSFTSYLNNVVGVDQNYALIVPPPVSTLANVLKLAAIRLGHN
jgi:hypothetical protein